jgi:NTE family protein
MSAQIIICLLFLACTTLQAQPIVRNLVFEGAGIRGIAYAGAISELERQDLLKGVQRVGGTSAGAITALLLSLGYTSHEISQIVQSTSFKKFNDGKFFFFGGIHRIQKWHGWYRGEKFEKWLSGLIQDKTGNGASSFRDLKQKGFKDLYITGTSMNLQRLFVFSFETFPDMQVKDAVRISAGIPFYFEPLYMNNKGTVFHRPKNTRGLNLMVDGGFMANYPLTLFDSSRFFDSLAPNRFQLNPGTLGFRIDRPAQVESDLQKKGLAPFEITNLYTYVRAFYTLIQENMNRQKLSADDWKRTVSISDEDISPRIRKLSKEEVSALLHNGAMATRRYLETMGGR